MDAGIEKRLQTLMLFAHILTKSKNKTKNKQTNQNAKQKTSFEELN